MDGCVPWWPLPPWAASDGKGQNGLSTVRSEKMKALTAERCWENPTRCLALLVRRGQPLPQESAGKSHLFRLAQQVQRSPPGLPELVATFWEAQELRRREASCQLEARLILSPEGQTTAFGYPWPGCFWAKTSLAINKLLLTAEKFWVALQHAWSWMQDSCVTVFDNCVSQVSLLLSLTLQKSRELEGQSQPTENLKMDVSLLAQGSTSTHSISAPWESFRANFKAYMCLKRQQGEPLMQCCSGQPGTLLPFSAELWAPSPPSHPWATSHRVKQAQSS